MHHDLVILHKRGASLPELTESWAQWTTCLRQIAFGHKSLPLPAGSYDVFAGEDAYTFCLEVVCGLRSPLAGETEVMGQFRDFLAKLEGPHVLKKFMESVLKDAKSIRHKHLSKLGSQSYGSLCRRYLEGVNEVHVLGSGQLTRELLPWFSSQKKVTVHCRQPQRHQKLAKDHSFVEVTSFSERLPKKGAVVVIAAPLSSQELKKWIGSRDANQIIKQIIDLRGESKTDPLKGVEAEVVSLRDFYKNLEDHQSQIKEKVEAAREDIQRLSSERTKTAELRPFGWDDLCA